MNNPQRKRTTPDRPGALRPWNRSRALTDRRLLALCTLVAFASCAGDAQTPNSFVEDFENRRYDRDYWEIHRGQLPDAYFRVRDEGLVIRVPASATGGKPAAFKSQFLMSGDFDIGCEYSLKSFPTPEKASVNFGIWLDGPAGMATFRRTNQALMGTGFAMWDKSSAEGAKSNWRFFRMPLDIEEGRSELVVQRRGPEVRFLARASPDVELKQLATLDYPADIESMQFRVQADEVSEPVEAQIHAIRVDADRIWFNRPDPPWYTTQAAKISLAVLSVLAVGAVLLLVRRRPAVDS